MFYAPKTIRNIIILAASILIFITLLHTRPSDTFTAPTPPYRLFNSNSTLPPTPHAIATFLTGQDEDDTYLTATRVLAYQLLHAPSTRINLSSISFLVLCSSTVSPAHKQRLHDDGVTVVDVASVPVNWWIRTGVTRWKEQFTKLRIFQITEYSRILFLDADTMVMSPLDGIFQDPDVVTLDPTLLSRKEEIRVDEAPLPSQWLFAARSDNAFLGERRHPVPPLQTTTFSAGFWLVAPDRQMFDHLLSVMSHFRRFDPHTMEQSLLNYIYRRTGPMPWRELSWKWSATWPSELDADLGVASLHEKWWKIGSQRLRERWREILQEMQEFHGTAL